VSYALREAGRQVAVRAVHWTAHQRIGIRGEDLVIVIVIVPQENVRIRDAVLLLDDCVVDLRNANEKDPVSARITNGRLSPKE